MLHHGLRVAGGAKGWGRVREQRDWIDVGCNECGDAPPANGTLLLVSYQAQRRAGLHTALSLATLQHSPALRSRRPMPRYSMAGPRHCTPTLPSR